MAPGGPPRPESRRRPRAPQLGAFIIPPCCRSAQPHAVEGSLRCPSAGAMPCPRGRSRAPGPGRGARSWRRHPVGAAGTAAARATAASRKSRKRQGGFAPGHGSPSEHRYAAWRGAVASPGARLPRRRWRPDAHRPAASRCAAVQMCGVRCVLSAWSCTTARHIGGAGSMAVADIASMPGGPPPGRPGPALAPRRHGVAVASALPAGTRRRHRAPVPDHCRIAAPQPGHVPAQARREPPDPYARRHATPAAPVRCPHPQRPITAARFALSRRERPGVRRRRVAPGPRSRGAVAAIGLATNRRCATPCPMAPTTTALKDSPPGKARRVRTLVVGGPRTVTGRRVASDPKGSLPPWRCRRWQPSCGTAPRCVNAEAWGIMPGRVPPTAPAAARGITGAVRERVRAACVVAAGPPLRQDTGNAPTARLLRACPRGSWSKKRRGRGVEA